ncbi:MAG: dipeptidyl aminopeptidase/acylaminoacyl-peptidase family protein [Bacteroidetes bacterium HLUCCA01]|nr:MAG: dipeptidyl aminopeptidase/acylaminoacyl-peptidase family protein [Bacteroidetes bacterium HLUCCA01]
MSKNYYFATLPTLLLVVALIALQPVPSNAAGIHATTPTIAGSHQVDERSAEYPSPDLRSASEQQTTNSSSADHHAATDAPDRTLSVERLWEMQRVGAPTISPNGRWIVAPVTRYTVDDDKAHTDIWLFTPDRSVERPLTRHGAADGSPVFSPDGHHLAFISRRDGDSASQLYILPLNEPGEATRLTEVPTGVGNPKWVGNHIYFTSSIFKELETWEEMQEQLDADRASHISAFEWTELPFSSWDRYLDASRETHVYRIPANGGDVEAITRPTGWSASSYDVSPDESLVAFVTDTNRDDTDSNVDIYLVAPGSSEARNITTDNPGVDASPLFSPNGRLLAFTRQRINGFYSDTRRLNLYDVNSGAIREVTTEWDRSADGLVWAPDGNGLYGSIDDAGMRNIWYIPVAGRNQTPRRITAETDFPAIDIAGNGTMVAQNHSFLYPPRLVMVNTRNGATTRIDTINDDILAEVDLGTYESVTYTGANGQDIQMWVHYPPGFDETKQYPLFLLIHGGPHNGITDGFHFRWNAQTFASWGYVTAWHNFHGSSGFGQDFADAINPDWLTKPLEDTRRAAQWFAEKPWIDADRMVAGGGSYGGYLSSILLGVDHPFNALLIHAPVYNMYSQMAADFSVHSVRFGDYWDNPDIYKEISPHYYAGSFNTPALIIHGQTDLRVPVGQAFELFRTLQHRGVESKLVYYPDENHWILKPNNSIHWYHTVREWVERHAEPGGR